MTDNAARAQVVAAARQTVSLGLTHGTSGNVSCRIPGGLLITPTGMPYDDVKPADVVAIGLDGELRPGEVRRPSSEWRMTKRRNIAEPCLLCVTSG